VLLILFIGIALLSVPLFGGRLGALADLRFRRVWALLLALGLQVLIMRVVPEGDTPFHRGAHLGSYALAAWFVVANRRIPGIWLIGLGGGLNLLAIAANGGVIPASASALEAIGYVPASGEFTNSVALADPNLAFLGDIFAVPPPFPFANVFSVGDLCIALGTAVALHRVCGSRLLPSGAGQYEGLHRHRGFARIWSAQAVSNLGDWIYSLAVVATLAERGGGAHALAGLLLAQVAPGALAGVLGGPLVDRFPRKVLMVSSDVARCLAVGSLFLAGEPSLTHIYAVAVALGLFGSLFQPSLQASIPNLVPRQRIVAANAAVSATYNFAVMAGPVIGGLLVASVGARPAFAVQATSFLISAALVAGVRLPARSGSSASVPARRALVEGIRYALGRPVIRWALLVIGLVMFAASIRSPLEPLLVLNILDLRPEALGLVGGVWGLGMVLGSVAAPAAARRWARERLLAAAIGVVGVAVVLASGANVLSTLLLLWLVSGFANGLGVVAYSSLLQERTPDAFRGRVMAASEAVLQGSLLAGASAAAWFASTMGVRTTFAISGGLFVMTAALCGFLLRAEREVTALPDEPAPQPSAVSL
jgi:MFS family permease